MHVYVLASGRKLGLLPAVLGDKDIGVRRVELLNLVASCRRARHVALILDDVAAKEEDRARE